mmetsp:Transcript_25321/g.88386  ORF Transcript_25321/g.88386 Transcript_25321/m.88386 type:complete len:570 (-) Transcript_25321:157-1866(-)
MARAAAMASAFICVALLAALAAPAAAEIGTGDVKLELDAIRTMGSSPIPKIALLEDGVLTSMAALAAAVPVPGNVNDAFLEWESELQLGYSLVLSVSDVTIMDAPTVTVPSVGIVPAAGEDLVVSHVCKRDGTVRITLDLFFFTYDASCAPDGEGGEDGESACTAEELLASIVEQTTPLQVVYSKLCDESAHVQAGLPSACGGSQLAGTPAYSGPIKVATWNVAGFLQGGLDTHSVAQAEEVAATLSADDYSLVFVQDAWAPSFVSTLRTAMEGEGYSLIISQLKAPELAQTSGMMFFSKMPVRHCSFNLFKQVKGGDQLESKGVFSALVDAGGGFSYFVVTGHAQSSPWQYAATRGKQLQQFAEVAEKFVSKMMSASCTPAKECSLFGGAAGLAKMGFIVAGTLNVDAAADTAGYNDMIAKMTQDVVAPRDWWAEAHPDDDGLTTIALDITCPADGKTAFFACTAGESVTYSGGRIDYLMSWDSIDNRPDPAFVNALVVSDVKLTLPEKEADEAFVKIGDNDVDSVSTHYMLSATVEHGSDEGPSSAATATVSVLCAVVALLSAVVML